MAPRAAFFLALVLTGCFPPGEGLEPPSGRVYFPVGLAVDEEQKFLFIVNSDFDLQFNAGTVQSWDLTELRRRMPRHCTTNDDCACEDCDPEKTECDLVPREANRNAPSHWCVERGGSPCGALGEQSDRSQALYPGRCSFINQMHPQDGGAAILPVSGGDNVVFGRSVVIGAFATDVIRRTLTEPPGWQPSTPPPMDANEMPVPRQRLFIPVRGDATLHWIDINSENGTLECGQDGTDDGSCNDKHRSGDRSDEENTRSDGRLAPEPFGVDADENGTSLIVTNQTSGSVALFTHLRKTSDEDGDGIAETSTINWDAGPRYVFFESGMPQRPIGVANMPLPLATPKSGRERLPGFLVSFRNAPVVHMVRVYDDDAADPSRPYTRKYESERILANSSGIDSRGIGVDAFHRKKAEQVCLERYGVDEACAKDPACIAGLDPVVNDDLQGCLERAAATPLDVFIANRAPSSLLLGHSQPLVSDVPNTDLPMFQGSIPLDLGPARVYVGEIKNAQGERERRIFATCFDSRRIAIYDPERKRFETEIVTGRGPQAMAFDIGDDHAFAYVGHFLDSYVGVVDLDQRHGDMYATMIATVGQPREPRASK